MQHHTAGCRILHPPQNAPAVTPHVHHGANIAIRYDHHRIHVWLIHMVNRRRFRPVCRVVDHLHRFIRFEDFVNHAWCGCEQAEVELALETFLNNLHVQQSKEATTESEAKRRRRFRLERKRSIVHLHFRKRFLKLLELHRFNRIQTTVDHRLCWAIPWQRLDSSPSLTSGRTCIPDAAIGHTLDRSMQITR